MPPTVEDLIPEAGGGFDGELRAMAFTTCLFWMDAAWGLCTCACADGWEVEPGSSRVQAYGLFGWFVQ